MALSDSIKGRCARCWGTGRLAEAGRVGARCPDCGGLGEDVVAGGDAGLDLDLER